MNGPGILRGHLPGRDTVHAVTLPPIDGYQVTYCGAEYVAQYRAGHPARLIITGDLRDLRDLREVTCGRCRRALSARGLI